MAEVVPVMVVCPICTGDGCRLCHESGAVKLSNLERAREQSAWSDGALDRLLLMIRGER